ncbi:uncharacterized protein LY89DRAFT_408827 [Mollisia scopiformis]|uniref:Uncharacterized protein n=1 Tax=Mollisia scopiformis TaxID=149040 RepID=A0A132B2Q2_MOLSC|nr:uncharacterized protein LY89DRAFT_408827 [Mollisia scopiformis]KUJ06611.1 hypothetical protein LY89DRAFT_408827 [Mollisia scopiformis]
MSLRETGFELIGNADDRPVFFMQRQLLPSSSIILPPINANSLSFIRQGELCAPLSRLEAPLPSKLMLSACHLPNLDNICFTSAQPSILVGNGCAMPLKQALLSAGTYSSFPVGSQCTFLLFPIQCFVTLRQHSPFRLTQCSVSSVRCSEAKPTPSGDGLRVLLQAQASDSPGTLINRPNSTPPLHMPKPPQSSELSTFEEHGGRKSSLESNMS